MAGSVLGLFLAIATAASPFSHSSSCVACHNQVRTASGDDVPIASGWRGSMMANAARDPYWQAAVRRETLDHPQAAAAIQHECAACHMPMVRFPEHRAGAQTSVFANTATPLAMDGVSCSVCHQLTDRMSVNGDIDVDVTRREIAGPFAIDAGRTRVMSSASGFTPAQQTHLRSSMVCATCHTLFTHALTKDGRDAGQLPEQVPFLEWRHSAWRGERSCQSCHMPEVDAPITSVLPQPRTAVSKHEFRGGNAFMQRILRTNAVALGVTAPAAELIAAETRTEEYSRGHAARLDIDGASVVEGRAQFEIAITNLAGHKLPTAYPSRRVWLHVSIRDAANAVVFESGALRPNGAIDGNDNDSDGARYEPHYRTVQRSDQVQIYEAILADAEGAVTTGLISAVRYVKDNRILPRGFDKSTAGKDIAVHGEAATDPDFVDLGDRIRYDVDLSGRSGPFVVEAELLYQPIAFRWAENLRGVSSVESKRFAPMYDAAANESATRLAMRTITVTGEALPGAAP